MKQIIYRILAELKNNNIITDFEHINALLEGTTADGDKYDIIDTLILNCEPSHERAALIKELYRI
jgi:hypothetical protein